MNRINFVIPIKVLVNAKTRLQGVLSAQERAALAKGLLMENLKRLRGYYPEQHILVVTPDHEVEKLLVDTGITCLLEASEQGLISAVETATRWSVAHGFDTQLVLAPDIAFWNKAEVETLIHYCGTRPAVTICAAKDGGTNAILTSPPNVIHFFYGANSSQVMEKKALRLGVTCNVLNLKKMSLDIDTPFDLLRSFHQYRKAVVQKTRIRTRYNRGTVSTGTSLIGV